MNNVESSGGQKTNLVQQPFVIHAQDPQRLNQVIKLQVNPATGETTEIVDAQQIIFSQNPTGSQTYPQIRLVQGQEMKDLKTIETNAANAPPIQLQPIFDKPKKMEMKEESMKLVDSQSELNRSFSIPAKAEEVQDHIDSIINEVASGSGIIPYSSDFDDDESKLKLI